jgi:hypothetical protein
MTHARPCRTFGCSRRRPARNRLIRATATALAISLTALWAGCSAPSSSLPKPSARTSSRSAVAELHLFGVPVTLNLDDRPGPDGFAVTLYASNGVQDKGIAIKNGTVRFLMYDGASNPAGTAPTEPRHTWTFSTEELQAFEGRSAIGIGYRFALRWGEALPKRDRIVIVAQYTGPDQRTISSQPSTITVASK